MKKTPPFILILTGLLILGTISALILAPFPEQAPLHHIPTLIFACLFPLLYHRLALSNASFLMIFIFLLLHTLGGFYNYSFVPYDLWAESLSGHSISEIFNWHRNHYDRLIHFSFGILLTYPLAEVTRRFMHCSNKAALFIAFLSIAAASAIYEIFEWYLTVFIAGDFAVDYNGQQGDMWDAQKDMAFAIFGSLIVGIAGCFYHRRLEAKS